MSEAVICTVPQPYALASSTALRNSSVAMPRRRYLGSVYMLDNKPYELTLDLMPIVLGSEQMPSDSLKLYRDLIEPVPVDTTSFD